MSINFGTDGWRAVISDQFTFANVRIVAQAVAEYVKDPARAKLPVYHLPPGGTYSSPYRPAGAGLVVGYDTRFLSPQYARAVAEVLAANGIPVRLVGEPTATPAVSLAVRDGQTAGAVMVTASHNPPDYNGIKFKAEYASSGLPEIMDALTGHLRRVEGDPARVRTGPPSAPIEIIHAGRGYLDALRTQVDWSLIDRAAATVVSDSMYGATQGYLPALLAGTRVHLTELRGTLNPGFGGTNPEPIAKNLEPLLHEVKSQSADAGFAFDGDGDRIGAADRTGRFLNSHEIYALMLRHLVEHRGYRGGVVKTFSTSVMIDRLAAAYGLPVHETPIGFKYICRLMLEQPILMGGEESGGIGVSGHIPERDGLLCALILLEAMAVAGKGLDGLLADLRAQVGAFAYDRVDLRITSNDAKDRVLAKLAAAPPTHLNGSAVAGVQTLDGVKLVLHGGAWLLFRASGTEPVLRLYAESDSPESVGRLLAEAQALVLAAEA